MGSSRSKVSKGAAYNLGKHFQPAMQTTGVRRLFGSCKPCEWLYTSIEYTIARPDRRQRSRSSGRREMGPEVLACDIGRVRVDQDEGEKGWGHFLFVSVFCVV